MVQIEGSGTLKDLRVKVEGLRVGTLAVEREEFNRVFMTDDAKRGILAFIDKETPEFRGE